VLAKQVAHLRESLTGLASEGFKQIYLLQSVEDVQSAKIVIEN